MNLFKRKQNNENKMLHDISYIQDMKHISGEWHQYDFLLAARPYGWDYILDSAEYMTQADLKQIGTISVSERLGEKAKEYIQEYDSKLKPIKSIKALKNEAAALGVGGISKTLGFPVKIVWINQSRILRIFAEKDDEDLMNRYAETVLRRTFKTADQMKKAQPVPKKVEE